DEFDEREPALPAAAGADSKCAAHECSYFTVTPTCETPAFTCCWAMLTIPARVMASTLVPALLAWKVRTQTTPDPLKPAAPGGREATTVTLPAPSSRCTNATACPSRAR